ncbi:hypothetical protein PAHAL_1G237200 [Panicum hallii]|uniref:NB-ARC domain-containing protein n=1 Tax=Panicum hallii TaxID=206008 RepID=A0A2S3GP11_9POAL|nr:uncharacterized protein LOC112902106 [Panicum hallii]PAN05537.1 hypothetical protein PAHAL_1G237200 [Panicum hallii]
METLLSSVLGEVMARSINFILSKVSTPPAPALEDSLQRALLQAQVIVDEATGRHITNQAMLLQLDMLRDAVHKGSYALDNFRYHYQPHATEDDTDQPVRRSVPLSIANCAKIPRFSRGSARILAQLREALDRLISMVADADVLVLFLTSYPRRYRQPYSMHLMLDNCMFGRQMETEHVISFLLHAQPSHGAEEPEVLPIVGPGRVGKTTVVTHVCKDERVRDRFSEIVLLNDLDFTDGELAALRQRCSMRNGDRGSNSNSRDGKFLVVVEVAGDFNEDAWTRLYSSSKLWMPRGSKIIVTSRSDKVTRVGTARPLTLKFLPREAYWYFFRTLAFGSADPGAHPRLANMAMEVARNMNGAFISAHITARVLRGNLDARFWGKVLALYREFVDKHGSRFGGNPFATLNQDGPALLGRMGRAFADLMIHHHYECSSPVEVPDVMTVHEVIFGSEVVRAQGKFQFVWTSPIPPYYSHIYTCEILGSKPAAAKRKRSVENEVALS